MSVEDVRALMRARKLPDDYGNRFIAAARGNRWWSNSIGCGALACVSVRVLRGFTVVLSQ